MFLITHCIFFWAITWTDQINRQCTEDFSRIAHPPCVEQPQGTEWTAIKEDEWGIWISHPGSPHYMSYSFLNPHQHSRDFHCDFTATQARWQSPKRKKNLLFLPLHDAAVTYKLIKIKTSSFIIYIIHREILNIKTDIYNICKNFPLGSFNVLSMLWESFIF